MKANFTEANLKDLNLDFNNPRFAELYSGSGSEDDLIEYLLYNESAEEVAKGIHNVGEFYPDRPLWIIEKDGSYLVKDGNRRCAAVKALKHPSKYGLDLPKHEFTKLPVLLYNNEEDVDSRILEEHTNNLFREWDRIAKAIEVYKMYSLGNSLDNMKEIDSQPSQLIKLASFYYEAVKIAGDDLRKLLRRGRGRSGGKTIIFERLFGFSNKCGYSFRNKPSYKVFIKDKYLFESYIKSLVTYLQNNPSTKTQDIDENKDKFLDNLKSYGFPPERKQNNNQSTPSNSNATSTSANNSSANSSNNNSDANQNNPNQNNSPTTNARSPSDATKNAEQNKGTTKHSIKHTPTLKRKKIPSGLKKLIDECYNLDENKFPNAKTALTRVVLECTLKYVVENTKKSNGKAIKESNHFASAFKNSRNKPLTYTNFDALKTKFAELIKDTGTRKALEDFDIQNPHQIIHNYKVGAVPVNSKALCDNLIDLLEFLLQEEKELVNSLDLSKL